MTTGPAGFREVEHTADWELEVWAADLAGLLEQAATGMYRLMGVRFAPGKPQTRHLELQAEDREGLLVAFLSELLYLTEMEKLGFDEYQLSIEGDNLSAQISGYPIDSLSKEIKAVTYHHLDIRERDEGLAVNVVFDV
jgi:SHS2 domain-containing protein